MSETLFAQITNFIQAERLLEKKDKVVLAVSGGPDSVFLLYYFVYLASFYQLRLLVAHFNHGLREAAEKEEEFVAHICHKLKLDFVSEKREVKKLYRGDSWENVARRLRFDFFLKVCRRHKIKKVALAHHKDDLAETVLLRLIRGSGLLGLQGIKPLNVYKKIILIRPLLFLEKEEIVSFLKKNKITYMLDESNQEEKFLRNKIRLRLLPYLRQYNPAIKNSLYNLGRIASYDYELLAKLAEEKLSAISSEAKAGLRLNIAKLKELPLSLFFLVLRMAIENTKGNLKKIELRHLEKVKELVFSYHQGSLLNLPDLDVLKEEKTIYLKARL